MIHQPPAEIMEDIDWLLAQGIHPELVLDQLGRTAGGVERAARRLGRLDLARMFGALKKRMQVLA